jgi:hypothetical protein
MKDHRQPKNPRNIQAHEESSRIRESLMRLLPVNPVPLTISQQIKMTQLIKFQNSPMTEKPNTLRKG